MSKLGMILHPRTLPPVPQNVLFSDCNPVVPEILVKSWQNTGTFVIVSEPASMQSKTVSPVQEQATEAVRNFPIDCTDEESDCPWMSRLAVEWQVGVETLVPLTSQCTTPHKSLTRLVETVFDTTAIGTPTDRELGLVPAQINSENPCSQPLRTASTTYLADKLMEAVCNGSASTVEQVLQLINRQSQSTEAVLLELKKRFAITASTPLTVDWETGTGANGKSFTRISFTMMNDWTNGSGATKLIIGSDGTTYATFTERWNSTPLYLSPDEAIAKVKGNSLKPVRELNRSPQKSINPAIDIRPSRAPRHFKAAGF